MLNIKLNSRVSTWSMLLTLAAVAFSGGLFVAPAHAATSDVTQLKITSSAQPGQAGTLSSVFIVETEDSSGNHVKVGPGSVTLNLTSDFATGQFFDANFSTNTCSSSTSTLSMASSSYQKGFCYKDSTPGVHHITVTAQGESWTAASQSFTIPFITNQDGVTFTSIQDAVNHTAAGGTITVPAGIYTDSATINKPLTLKGAQAGVAGADSSGNQRIGSETVVSSFTVTASNSDIDGFSFDNAGLQVNLTSPTTLSGIVIQNNIFSGYDSTGLTSYNAGNLVIKDNFFTNPSTSAEAIQIRAGSSAPQGCNGTQVLDNVFKQATTNGSADVNFSCTDSNSSNIKISGNTSFGLTNGQGASFTALSGITDGITISDNTLKDLEGSAIYFWGSVSGTALIDGNTITGGGSNAVSIHGGSPDVANTGTFTISNNTLTDNGNGVSIAANSLGTTAQVNISHNTISGNSRLGVANSSSITANASNNWWGVSNPDFDTLLSGDVTHSPWCEDSSCTPTRSFNVQDVTSGATFDTIQTAIASASDGDTISIKSGTYGGFSIDGKTGLTIEGAGSDQTVIAPTTLIDSGVTHKYTTDMKVSVLVKDSSNITLSNLAIHDNGSAVGSGGPDALVLWDASSGTIENSNIKGTYTINGIQSGQGIAVDASGADNADLTVKDTDISGFQKNGIDIINGNGATSGATGTVSVTVEGGSITGAGPTTAIAQNGLVVWNRGGGTVTASIDGTTISGFDYTPAQTVDDESVGVLAYGGGIVSSIKNASFENNQLDISSTAGSPAIDASNNWWGSVLGSDSSRLDGTITTAPWCEQADCSSTRSANAFVDLNKNGQFDSATETGYTTITAALASVTATSSQTNIFVNSGTYDENLVINKPIDLHNDARDDDGNPVAVLDGTIQVTNSYGFPVDISGLEITAPDSSYGIYVHGVGEVNIYDNYIHDIGTGLTSGSAQAIDIEPGANSISTIFINHNLITNVGSLDLVKGTGGTSAKGIYLGDSSGSSTIDGVTITNNTISSVFAGTAAFPAGRGAYGVLDNYGGQTKNFKVSGNTIHHLEGLWSHAIGLEADTPSAVVASNSISDLVDHKGNTDAVGIHFESNPSASTVTVSDNSFGSGVAIGVDNTNGSSDVVTANNNWWNDPAGPTATGAAGISSDVTAGVYYINPGLTVLSNAVQNGNLTATSGDLDFVASSSGQASLPNGVSTLTLSNSTVLNLSNNIATASGNTITLDGSAKDLTSFSSGNITNLNLTAPVVVGSASITVTKAVALKSGSASQPIKITNSALSNVSVSIPDSTTVLAPNNWDGKIQPPKSVSASGTAPSGFSVGGTVVEVGSTDGVLLFDQPVSVVLTGVTGTVGYLPSGSSTWVQITNQCSGTYANPSAPTFPGECYISDGTNTKIYTYHFTTFGTLTASQTSSSGGSSSSGSAGGGAVAQVSPTPTPTPASTPEPSPQPTVNPKPVAVSNTQPQVGNQQGASQASSAVAGTNGNTAESDATNPLYNPYPATAQQASIFAAIGNVLDLGTGQWWMALLLLALIALGISGFIRRRRNNLHISDQMDDEKSEK
ncbi:MAG TPA: right-handed parallel beta-helix repeat-containing protein [Candidatus Saccharimonadales bacterium]|nr:right-handed parallel beta-helix repeat-containing protein [Candidatus Saccharimonadales bacterium]